MRTNVEIDVKLSRRLYVLLDQPRRKPEKAAYARAAYLNLAQELANSSSQAVTTAGKRRHIGWMHPLQQFFRIPKKEHSPMFGTLGTILLIVSLILGSGGVTVAAAQNSLPDQALYPVKTWSEDVRTDMAGSSQTRFDLAREYTNRRVEEMQVMLQAGQVPPESVEIRMQEQIDLALRLAAGQPDREAVKSLEQMRQQLQAHEQAFTKLGPGAGTQGEGVLDRTRTMLQDRLHLCDQGIQDPVLLRQQLRDRDRVHPGDQGRTSPVNPNPGNPWTTGTPTPGSGYGPGPGTTSSTTTPGGGNNPWTTGTPTPGSGYGPGDGVVGNGGNNPWTTGTPTPGSGYGPGPATGSGSGSGSDATGGSTGGNGAGTGSDTGTKPGDGDGGSGSGSGGGQGTGDSGGSGGRH